MSNIRVCKTIKFTILSSDIDIAQASTNTLDILNIYPGFMVKEIRFKSITSNFLDGIDARYPLRYFFDPNSPLILTTDMINGGEKVIGTLMNNKSTYSTSSFKFDPQSMQPLRSQFEIYLKTLSGQQPISQQVPPPPYAIYSPSIGLECSLIVELRS